MRRVFPRLPCLSALCRVVFWRCALGCMCCVLVLGTVLGSSLSLHSASQIQDEQKVIEEKQEWKAREEVMTLSPHARACACGHIHTHTHTHAHADPFISCSHHSCALTGSFPASLYIVLPRGISPFQSRSWEGAGRG